MEIKILELIEGSKKAKGLAVIIDVFGAFSVAAYLFGNSAEKIIPVSELDQAYSLKEKNPSFMLAGERGGKKQEGFDFGNSPAEIQGHNFNGKIIVQTTSAGTKGIYEASDADEIITGGFVNASSVIRYIQDKNPGYLSLVAMGEDGKERAIEDLLFAEYVRDSLLGKPVSFDRIKDRIIRSPVSERFYDKSKPHFPEADLGLCLDLDRFKFLLKANKDKDGLFFFSRIDLDSSN